MTPPQLGGDGSTMTSGAGSSVQAGTLAPGICVANPLTIEVRNAFSPVVMHVLRG